MLAEFDALCLKWFATPSQSCLLYRGAIAIAGRLRDHRIAGGRRFFVAVFKPAGCSDREYALI